MGKIVLDMKPILGQGFLRFSNFSGEGEAEASEGSIPVKFSKWDPNVQMTIKRSLIEELQLPSTFKVIIEWE